MELRILQVENILSVDSLDGYDYVVIKELSNKMYKVLNNIDEMESFKKEYYGCDTDYGTVCIKKDKFKKENIHGAIINFTYNEESTKDYDLIKYYQYLNTNQCYEEKFKFNNFINMIFVNKFEFKHEEITIENCYFKETYISSKAYINNTTFTENVTIENSSYLSLKDTKVEGELFIRNFKEDNISFYNVELNNLNIEKIDFNSPLKMTGLKISNNFKINNCTFNYCIEGSFTYLQEVNKLEISECNIKKINMKEVIINFTCDIYNCKFIEEAKFTSINITKKGAVYFKNTIFCELVVIDFNELKGKFYLYKTSFSDKCLLDYEKVQAEKYEAFKGESKLSKWTFYNASEIYKQNGKNEQYLDTYYMYKKYEREEKQGINILDWFVEVTTKYFTSWKRTLLSIASVILIYFVIYMICSGNLKYGSGYVNYTLWSTIGNSLYFSLITFTTIGYGDISPVGFLKLVAASEGLLGIFLTSSLLVTLTRKYT